MSGEGFLHRWSRLKRGGGVADPAPDAASETDHGPDTATPQARQGAQPVPMPVPPPTPPHGLPPEGGEDAGTPVPLPPIESLRPDSDFSPFMQAGVDPVIRNAALARLFADPHFSVMDGLDVYIDDYGKSEPIPPSLMHHLDPTRSLGLFEPVPQVGAEAAPGRGETQVEFTHDESPGVARMRDAPAPNELLPTPDAQVLANVNPAENPEPQGTVADPNSRPTSK